MVILTIINNLHLCKFSRKLVCEGRELSRIEVDRNVQGSLLQRDKTRTAQKATFKASEGNCFTFVLYKRELKYK